LNERTTFNQAILPVCLPADEDDSKLFLSLGTYGEVCVKHKFPFSEGIIFNSFVLYSMKVVGSKLLSTRSRHGELSGTFVAKRLQVLPPKECAENILRESNNFEYCAGHKGNN